MHPVSTSCRHRFVRLSNDKLGESEVCNLAIAFLVLCTLSGEPLFYSTKIMLHTVAPPLVSVDEDMMKWPPAMPNLQFSIFCMLRGVVPGGTACSIACFLSWLHWQQPLPAFHELDI